MPFLIEVKADGADMDLLKEILVNVYELKPKKILKKSDKIDVGGLTKRILYYILIYIISNKKLNHNVLYLNDKIEVVIN